MIIIRKSRPALLLVDDSLPQLNMLKSILEDSYDLYTASDGCAALDFLKNHKVDIILSDIIMPNMNGMVLYQTMKKDSRFSELPIIFISAVTDVEAKVKLLDLGAYDYITKPFDPLELKARVGMHLKALRRQKKLEESIARLNRQLKKQVGEADSIYDLFYGTIVNIALAKSKETGLHLVRTKYYLAELLKKYLKIYHVPEGIQEKNESLIVEHMMQASTMHDIGKVGIPDHILMKPGKLSSEEFEIMKSHTIIGHKILTSESISINNIVLKYATQITRWHHERWDGSGYPDALSHHEIPFTARVMAIADVYDALVSKRVYKAPILHEEAVKIIYKEAGKGFDPILIDIFLNEHQTFHKIAKEYKDKD